MAPKNVKQAMEDDSLQAVNIYAKGEKKIRVDFKPRFNRGSQCSFWIDRDYFQRNYPSTYARL
jgi:hypothetical protein